MTEQSEMDLRDRWLRQLWENRGVKNAEGSRTTSETVLVDTQEAQDRSEQLEGLSVMLTRGTWSREEVAQVLVEHSNWLALAAIEGYAGPGDTLGGTILADQPSEAP